MIKTGVLSKPVKRVWVLGDLHFGVRSNSMEWLQIQKDFFEEVFIPNLKKHVKPGDVLVQVGDKFDNRQSINIKVLNYAMDLFERLGEILPVHVICGNHDISTCFINFNMFLQSCLVLMFFCCFLQGSQRFIMFF